mmetsp:Transcript_30483/g.65642  ORF Transcript_30483/g.65642 Transcript_30483/m.65642 type:complete len:207 (+) Transcript_30483:89-709(+)|eukprot:CAMPEP_0206452202 /NCGR_PEP_ID=MMETSP0324_2-20121206/19812_1 /ASSEMBLY_ACC=CAM_ASM_000836 /TAXON_ID=2866 /ORGANISM="Crypthecodinium cohnii, Strain Seligo" /LENGTH=206 /DNA_ID=CAMNT_0053922261 /DNA_START=82 /DNA_END=702 /DNA_ORIENTATION=+
MRRLFGSTKEAAPTQPAPSLQEASAKIDTQISNVESKIQQAEQEIKKIIASGSGPAAKARAMQAMKRKKMYEQQRDTLMGSQFTMEQMAFNLEQAEATATTVAAMKAGTEKLKEQMKSMSPEQVDEVMDDMAEINDEFELVSQALASTAGGGVDDAELMDEYLRMEEEMALSKVMEGGSGLTAATPAPAAAAASTALVPEAAPSAP